MLVPLKDESAPKSAPSDPLRPVQPMSVIVGLIPRLHCLRYRVRHERFAIRST
jgi:hypothetical protein